MLHNPRYFNNDARRAIIRMCRCANRLEPYVMGCVDRARMLGDTKGKAPLESEGLGVLNPDTKD